MAVRPNYRQERAARERTKENRKQKKLRRLEEETAKRKALREGAPTDNGEPKG